MKAEDLVPWTCNLVNSLGPLEAIEGVIYRGRACLGSCTRMSLSHLLVNQGTVGWPRCLARLSESIGRNFRRCTVYIATTVNGQTGILDMFSGHSSLRQLKPEDSHMFFAAATESAGSQPHYIYFLSPEMSRDPVGPLLGTNILGIRGG